MDHDFEKRLKSFSEGYVLLEFFDNVLYTIGRRGEVIHMGLQREIVAVCDLCSKRERFEDASNTNEAKSVALEKGWFVKKKGTTIDFVICPKCRSTIA